MQTKKLSLRLIVASLMMLVMGVTEARAWDTVTEDGITWRTVNTAAEFKKAVEANENVWVRSNIDLSQISAVEDDMVFDYDLKFTGRIRGDYVDKNGKDNMAIVANSPYMLFLEIENAHFSNLIFFNCKFIGWDRRSGQLAAEATNCEFTNIIMAACTAQGDQDDCDCDHMGGLIGKAHGSTFDKVLVLDGKLATDGQCAGLVAGIADGCRFTNCFTNAASAIWADGNSEGMGILENAYCGGICGYSSSCTFDTCINMAMVTGNDDSIGGIIGYGEGTTLTNCNNLGMVCHNTADGFADMETRFKSAMIPLAAGIGTCTAFVATAMGIGTAAYIMGFGFEVTVDFLVAIGSELLRDMIIVFNNVGFYILAPVMEYVLPVLVVAAITVSIAIYEYDPDEAGGIAGTVKDGSVVRKCSNYGSVKCFDAYGGGIVGYASGSTIEACLNHAMVTGDEQTGGIVGYVDDCKVRYNLNISAVRANNDKGYIEGEVGSDNDRHDNYFLSVEDKDYGSAHARTQEQLASGAVALALNTAVGNNTDIGANPYHQDLGNSIYPTLDASVPAVTSTIEVTDDMLWQKVSNVGELAMALCNPAAKIELTADINMAGGQSTFCNFSSDMPFKGEVKGNGHSLLNCAYAVYHMDTEVDAGLFSYAKGAKFSNLVLDNFHIAQANQIMGHHTREGLLVAVSEGCTYDHVTVRNSSIEKNSDEDWLEIVGGLVGYSTNDEFTRCTTESDCKFEGFSGNSLDATKVGGLVGHAEGSKFQYCINEASIKADDDYDGGLVGYLTDGVIENCLNTGRIEGQDYVGGMVGRAYDTKIQRCVNVGTITGDDADNNYLGGIVGALQGTGSYVQFCMGFGNIMNATANNCGGIDGVCEEGATFGGSNWYNFKHSAIADNVKNVEMDEVTSGGLTYRYANDGFYQSIDNGGWITNFPVPFPEAGKVYHNYNCVTGTETYSNIYSYIYTHEPQYNDFGFCEHCGNVGKSPQDIFIRDANDMARLAYAVEKGQDFSNNSIVLKNDIDMANIDADSRYRFYGIGTADHPFKGSFSGYRKTIKNLNIEKTWGPAGLFGVVGGNTLILDVVLDSTCSIRTSSYGAGGLVGAALPDSELDIMHCGFEGSVYGSGFVGSLLGAGMYSEVSIYHCYNTGTVKGLGQVASLCGLAGTTTDVKYSWNTGTVSGLENGMGMAYVSPAMSANMTIANCCDVNAQEGVTRISSEDVASGRLCYLVNGVSGKDDNYGAWYQKIGEDEHPMLNKRDEGGDVVYMHEVKYCGKNETDEVYDNSPESSTGIIHTYDENGLCLLKAGEIHGEPAALEDDTWSVSNIGNLYYVAQQVNSGAEQHNIVLLNDIQDNESVIVDGALNPKSGSFRQWTPIGGNNVFTKSFQGNNHTISGLYSNPTEQNYQTGLLGQIGGNASISNVGITDSYFGNAMYAGTIAGVANVNDTDYPRISHCYASDGAVSASIAGGGIVGAYIGGDGTSDSSAPITDCYNTCTVSASGATQNIGGIIGYIYISKGAAATADCYYLEGCATGTSAHGEAKSELAFRTGEVCHLLNEGTWSQAIGKQLCPAFGKGEVSYTRKVTAGNWGSLVLPFPVTSDEKVQYYTYKKLSGEEDKAELHLNRASTVPANTPCFFRTSADCSELSATADVNSLVAPTSSEVKVELSSGDYGTTYMIGTYDDITVTVSPQDLILNYYVAQNKLWWGEQAFNVAAYRAYLNVNYLDFFDFAKSLTFVVDDDETTGITTTIDAGQWNGKLLQNGKVVIVKNGVKYNAAGQRIL